MALNIDPAVDLREGAIAISQSSETPSGLAKLSASISRGIMAISLAVAPAAAAAQEAGNNEPVRIAMADTSDSATTTTTSVETDTTENSDAAAFAALLAGDEVVTEADLEREREETAAEREETAQTAAALEAARRLREGYEKIAANTANPQE